MTRYKHALQTAQIARLDSSGDAAIVAALPHDVGHLLMHEHRVHRTFLDRDLHHEEVGARWLSRLFPRQATDPVRLHVAAKRWLCAVDLHYRDALSAASRHSLAIQGGPMSADERAEFEDAKGWREAVALRLRDDKAKQPGRRTPRIESFRDVVLSCLIV